MKRPDLSRWAPPGLDTGPETRWFLIGWACAAAFACLYYCNRFFSARAELYDFGYGGPTSVLLPGAVMPDFAALLGGWWIGFAVVAVCALGLAAAHYAYHWQGGRSIYLMRRLPDRFVLHRRCLTLPALGLALCLLSAAVLLPLFYWLYISATPEECLTPQQWQKLWSVIR